MQVRPLLHRLVRHLRHRILFQVSNLNIRYIVHLPRLMRTMPKISRIMDYCYCLGALEQRRHSALGSGTGQALC